MLRIMTPNNPDGTKKTPIDDLFKSDVESKSVIFTQLTQADKDKMANSPEGKELQSWLNKIRKANEVPVLGKW